MKKLLDLTLLFSLIVTGISAKDYQISSPDGKINVTISVEKEITYSVQYEKMKIIEPSTVSFTFKQAPPMGKDFEIISNKNFTGDWLSIEWGR